jgi:uncharacterized protein
MIKADDTYQLAASDLVGYLNCRHLSALERAVAEGALKKPYMWDPLLKTLWERGLLHEQSYVEYLTKAGLEVVRIDGVEVTSAAVAETVAAMKKGVQVIVQGALAHGGWVGRADILRRVELPSALGGWSYEAVDTKLARETKAGAVLQLCLYSDLIEEVQGLAPEHMSVVVPWSDFEPQQYRFADYAAYFRRVKRELLQSLSKAEAEPTYPDPNEHCEVCGWRAACERRRRDDDHLCLVAGISKLQINELTDRGFPTMKTLAAMPLPLDWKPERGSAAAYSRVREQARIQVEAREAGEPRFSPSKRVSGLPGCRNRQRATSFWTWKGTRLRGNTVWNICSDIYPARAAERTHTGTAGGFPAPMKSVASRISSTSSWRAGPNFPACISTTTRPTSQPRSSV